MTKIKLCGLSRTQDIEAANRLKPDYIGFVFAPNSRRYVTSQQAAELRKLLDPAILTVGVFVDEAPDTVARLLNDGTIDLAQLHGGEDQRYLAILRLLTDKPLIQAFRVDTAEDVAAARESTADYILLDAGTGGTGTRFDWGLLQGLDRPYFLAGGLDTGNVAEAVANLHPFGVDVSSGIETGGVKDIQKMTDFVSAIRGGDGKEQEL
jgi:phosphoribosylanthranilate isomerase